MELEKRLSHKRLTEEAFDQRKRKCYEEKERALEAIDSINISNSDFTSYFGPSIAWTACRHHVLEAILSNIAKLIIGPSVGPKIDFI